MTRFFRLIEILARAVFKLLTAFLTLVTGSTSQSDEDDLSEGAFRGGVLNYRTGKLDDGTDPYGWYEED